MPMLPVTVGHGELIYRNWIAIQSPTSSILATRSDGLQTYSDGLQPTSDGLQT